MARKKKKTGNGIFPKLILAVFFIYAAGTLISNQIKTANFNSDTAKQNEIIQTEEMRNAQLQQALDSEIDDEYIEKEARKQGYINPNERVFRDTGE